MEEKKSLILILQILPKAIEEEEEEEEEEGCSPSLITISGAEEGVRWYSNKWTFRQSRIVRRVNGSGTMEAVPFNETLVKGETIEGRGWGTGCFINRGLG